VADEELTLFILLETNQSASLSGHKTELPLIIRGTETPSALVWHSLVDRGTSSSPDVEWPDGGSALDRTSIASFSRSGS